MNFGSGHRHKSGEWLRFSLSQPTALTAGSEQRPTVEPAGVVLLGADGRPPAQAPEDGEIPPHQVRGHACIQLVT